VADRISRSSTEIVKLANRLSSTETASRTNRNENIDTFRGRVYVADNPTEQFTGDLKDNQAEQGKFTPIEANFDINNDPVLTTNGEQGAYHQCYVYYYDWDAPDSDPNTEDQYSDAYWYKVKNLNKALFPKQTSFVFFTKSVSNESSWKLKFLKGGPARGETLSGYAIAPDDTIQVDIANTDTPSLTVTTPPATSSPGVESQPSKISHWKCVNGSLVWAEGRREGKIDDTLHDSRNEDLKNLLNSDKEITMDDVKKQLPWLKISDYLEVVAASESGKAAYQAENKEGYYGKYQMGYDAMKDHGYLPITDKQRISARKKHGNYTKATTEQMFLDANWDEPGMKDRYSEKSLKEFKEAQEANNGPAMMQIYKNDSNAQENSIAKYVTSRLQTIVEQLDGDLSDVADIHGLSAGAHLVGFGDSISKGDPNYEAGRSGIKDLIESGQDTKDANKTTSMSYIKKSTEAYIAKNGNPCEDTEADGEPGESGPSSDDTSPSPLMT